MRAVRVELGRPIPPFGEHPSDLPILGRTLSRVQEEALAAVGATFDAPEGPTLWIGDQTWVTPALLRAFLAAVPKDGGRLEIDGPFLEFCRPLQDVPASGPACFPLAWAPRGDVAWRELPAVRVDLGETLHETPFGHPALADASRPIPVTDAMVHTVEHWSHLLRVNLLALLAHAEGERRRFQALPWWRKALGALTLVWRARSLNRWRLAAAVGPRGKGCNIHPTATVEACILGDDVEVGPHAVVRASYLADGARIGEHAEVNLTVVGPKAQVARGTMANLCVLMEGAFLSPGFGHQASVFGREAFMAFGATLFDLSFGGEIRTDWRGARVSAGSRFLGSAVGHRAKIGPHVIIGYGEAVPNDAFLTCDPGRIFRKIPADLLPGTATFVRDGVIQTAAGPVAVGGPGSGEDR